MSSVPRLRVKAKDAWWTALVIDPVAGPAVGALHGSRHVTPDRLTSASLAMALCAAAAFATERLVLGAVLFQVSFLLDCMDGKLAYTRGQVGVYGAWYDVVVDSLRMLACYGGLVWGMAGGEDLSPALGLLVALYPVLAFSVIVTGGAWPDRASPERLLLPASYPAFLRAAPRRLGLPGSTVDAEAAVFTVGPLLAHPVAGLAVGAAFNLVHLLAKVALRLAEARRSRPKT